jgi:hypothetical protein
MQNDGEEKVREMAYWALSSPANQVVLSQHPNWQARIIPPVSRKRKYSKWWTALLAKLKIL